MLAGASVLVLLAFILGIPVGWQLRTLRYNAYQRWEAKAIEADHLDKANSTTLYQTMSNFSAELEQSVRDLYEHPQNCRCAYCQIKYGRNALPSGRIEPGLDVYHPEYVRALHSKNKGLQLEVKDLRAELERRDRQNAAAYHKLWHEVVDKENQGPVVVTASEDHGAGAL